MQLDMLVRAYIYKFTLQISMHSLTCKAVILQQKCTLISVLTHRTRDSLDSTSSLRVYYDS